VPMAMVEVCGGIQLIVVDRAAFRPLSAGLEIALQLRRLYPEAWQADAYARLLNHARTLEGVQALQSRAELQAGYQSQLDQFLDRRARYLMYPR